MNYVNVQQQFSNIEDMASTLFQNSEIRKCQNVSLIIAVHNLNSARLQCTHF